MKRLTTLSLSAMLLLIGGCTLTTKTIENGYLPNYHKLETIEDTKFGYHQRWVSRDLTREIAPFKPKAVYLAPVIYYPQLEQHAQLEQQGAERLRAYLDFELRHAVSQYFPLSPVKGEDILVIEPAVTAVKISLENMSPVEVIPFRAVISAINLSIGGRNRDVEMRLEAKISNGGNDKLLATTVHGGQGLQLENSDEKLTHQHVQQLIKNWAFAWDQQLKAYKQKLDDNS